MSDSESFLRLWRELDEVRERKGWSREALARRISELSGRQWPLGTLHDQMSHGRRIPWARAKFVVLALELDVNEWRPRWESAYRKDPLGKVSEKEIPREESAENAREEGTERAREEVPAADPSPVRRARIVRRTLSGVVAASAAAAIWLTTGGLTSWPLAPLVCPDDARQYKVIAFGHVVDGNGRGFADVGPGDVFVRRASGESRHLQGRYYGTVSSRHITGYVRINKLVLDGGCS